MARNKHPEQTLEKIVVTAARLFVEKGYEQTSVQDILDATGLSKGGLYHHFKSKEQILDAVMQRRIQYVNKRFQELIRNTPDKNAKEKLKKILGQLAADAETHALDQALTESKPVLHRMRRSLPDSSAKATATVRCTSNSLSFAQKSS